MDARGEQNQKSLRSTALEEQVCSIYLITLDNVEQCGDELEARAERLLDDARALSRSCSALLNNCDKSSA